MGPSLMNGGQGPRRVPDQTGDQADSAGQRTGPGQRRRDDRPHRAGWLIEIPDMLPEKIACPAANEASAVTSPCAR